MRRVARVVAGLAGPLLAAAPLTAQQTGPAQAAVQPLKHIPLGRQGQLWVGFGAQLRARVESWRNFGFGSAPVHDDDFVLYRVLLNADLHIGQRLRGFVEAKSAALSDRALPGGRRPSDADDIDLQNAYLELSLTPAAGVGITARAGRQELLFGKQRLVSPLDWANTRRTFDGARGTATIRDWTLDGFFVRPVRVVKSSFNRWDSGTDFFGLHATKRAGRVPRLDGYWLILLRDAAAFNGTVGRERRSTFGARLSGTARGARAEYDFEAAYQWGSLGAGTISAAMFSGEMAYTVAQVPGRPRLHAGLDYASGDGSPGGNVETFNQLFPLGHAFLGYVDVVGRQNVVALNAGVGTRPVESLQADVTAHHFRRASTNDGLYHAGGGVERAAGSTRAAIVGTELDATLTWRLGQHVVGLVGYSRFLAGPFIKESGAAEDIRFGYCSMQLTYGNPRRIHWIDSPPLSWLRYAFGTRLIVHARRPASPRQP